MKRVLEAFAAYCAGMTGLEAILEPSPIELAEPSIRLAFAGSRNLGNGRTRLPVLVNLTARGDGPDAYLEELAKASEASSSLFDEPFGFPISNEYDVHGMAYPEKLSEGGFEKNGEEGKKPFQYLEAWRVTLEFTPEDIPAS